MPCFYCGKRVSLVRQMSDADFCSDEHRKRYGALTRLALDGLLEKSERPAAPDLRPEPVASAAHQTESLQRALREPQHAKPRSRRRVQPEPEPERARPVAGPEPEPVYVIRHTPLIPPEAALFASAVTPAAAGGSLDYLADITPAPGDGILIDVVRTLRDRSAEHVIAAAALSLLSSPPIVALPRALSSAAAPSPSPIGCSRTAARPALRHLRAEIIPVAGLDRADLIPRAQLPSNRGCARQPATSGFLSPASEVRTGIRASLRGFRQMLTAGDYRPEPAPHPVQLRADARQATRAAFAGAITLPVRGFVTADAAAGAAPPGGTTDWLTIQPRPVTLTSALRFPAPLEFQSAPLSQPGFVPAPSACGIANAGLQLPGHPPALRFASVMRGISPAHMPVRPALEVVLPRLAAADTARTLSAQGSWIVFAAPASNSAARPAPTEPTRIETALRPMTGGLHLPGGAALARPVRELSAAPLDRLAAGSAVASGRRPPAPVTERLAQAVPAVEFPALGVRRHAPELRVSQRPADAQPGKPAAVKATPRVSADALAFGAGQASLPAFHANGVRRLLPLAGSEAHAPHPVAPQTCTALPAHTEPIGVSAALSLIPLPVSPAPAAHALAPLSFQNAALPCARTLPTQVPRAFESAQASRALLPEAPVRIGAAHLLAQSQHVVTFGAVCAGVPNRKPAGAAVAVPAACLPAALTKTASPLRLGLSKAIVGSGAAAPATGGSLHGGSWAPATASVTATSTRTPEPPCAPFPACARQLAAAPSMAAAGRLTDRGSARRASEWLPFLDAAASFRAIESRVKGVCWPAPSAAQAAREATPPARAGVVEKPGLGTAPDFAAPAVQYPESAPPAPALAEAPAGEVPASAAREDSRSANRKGRLAPVFRISNRPSRLPVFRTTVEKAHMPYGVFFFPETEDRDDERTGAPASGHAAPPVQPVSPDAAFPIEARESLDASPLLPVPAGPYAGAPDRAPGFGELPYAPELFFVDAGLDVLAMDLEAIADAYSPRWRSALKTASGLFRGVMLMIPGIVVLAMVLTGCSANGSLHDNIQDRAAVYLDHDFSKGLDGWYGARDWAKSWNRDAASGFVRAGQLALYRPSQRFSDYRLEFLAQIDGESIGWVYRAPDLQNYYATRLVVLKPGPLPSMALVRYQVVAGQETERVQIPVRTVMHNGRPYRIQQDVSGHGFTTSIEGEVIDFWTDDRLRTGGVGFFGGKEDTPHIYWMKLTHHDDFWGKLCATIAPNN